MAGKVKLTEWQEKAARYIKNHNDHGLGAIMPHSELIRAADALNALGLAEDRGGTQRRWLTDAGRASLSQQTGSGETGE